MDLLCQLCSDEVVLGSLDPRKRCCFFPKNDTLRFPKYKIPIIWNFGVVPRDGCPFTLVLDFRSYSPFDQFGDGGIHFIEVIEVNACFIVNTINVHSSPTDARMATISRIHEKWIQLVVTEEQGHFFERKILRCRLIWFELVSGNVGMYI